MNLPASNRGTTVDRNLLGEEELNCLMKESEPSFLCGEEGGHIMELIVCT